MESKIIDTDQRYTPEKILSVVREFMPGFMDPCTSESNPTGARYFCTVNGTFMDGNCINTKNGLDADWPSYWTQAYWTQAYVNPPCSRGQLIKWVDKCIEQTGRYVEIIALLTCGLGSEAGQKVACTTNALCFVKGRLAFGSPGGQIATGAKQPSVLAYYGKRPLAFQHVFGAIGKTWVYQ